MTFVRKTYEEICESILAQVTKGIVNERHTYQSNISRYNLEKGPVQKIVRVDGTLNGSQNSFIVDTDYRLIDDSIEWVARGESPDDSTVFFVNYSLEGVPRITDVNPGSVARTLIEAVSREIDFMYAQLNHVYLAGFIDTAMGSALDLVVSMLGVTRKPAEPALGVITFGRSTDPEEINVENEAHIHDGSLFYLLKSTPVKEVTAIEGVLDGKAHTFEQDVDYSLSGDRVEWLTDGGKPDVNSVFNVNYVTYERIAIPIGTRVSTYARRAEDTRVFETTEAGVLERTAEGRWEALISALSTTPGLFGNAHAGQVVVMPQPLVGVEYVINRNDILTGTDDESDDELRERARHALEVAGKATLISLESAISGVEGVSSVLVEDIPGGVAGVVKVIAQGGDAEEIMRVIDDTRAAGIKVEFSRPMIVNVDVNLEATLWRDADRGRVSRNVEERIRGYISSLDIGDDIVYNRIVNSTFGVDGVYDVGEVAVKAIREGEEPITSTKENLVITPEEMALAREVSVLIRMRGS